MEDPAFSSAVEDAYLDELSKFTIDRPVDSILHSELMARALYRADRTNAGLRFKRLVGREELEARLFKALRRRREENQ